jgi:CRP-like cAMP-binding protein
VSTPRPRPRERDADAALFARAVRHVAPVDELNMAEALACVRPRELSRGQYFLRAGETAREVAVVARGLLREHFVIDGGVERTKAFVAEGEFTGSLADLLVGGPARAFIVAEEPARLLVLPFAVVADLAAGAPAWARFAQRATERLLLQKAEREYELLALDAEARYAVLLAKRPGLEARVAARHVASYLGITPVHLSRLRRRRRERARARGG